jgi:hypothetical protein
MAFAISEILLASGGSMMRLQLGEEDTDCGFGTGECCARRILQIGRYHLFRLDVLSENNELNIVDFC